MAFPARSSGGNSELHRGMWKVYEPYFQPLLLDTLQHDVFAEIGKVRTLLDVPRGDRFIALVLSGRLEEAAEFIEADRARPVDPSRTRRRDTEDYRNELADWRRALLAHGIARFCEECHQRERERAEAMKLGDIWEPAPFPVELSGADREGRVSDPLFETTPWVSLPGNLWQEMPCAPGDTRFATAILNRQQRRMLWMPLSADEAKARHETYQNYVLSTRLASGMLVCLRHRTGFSPHDPEPLSNPAYGPRRTFYLDIYTPIGHINVRANEDLDERESFDLCGLYLYQPDDTDYKWSAHVGRDLTVSTRDSRSGETLLH